MNIEDTFLGFFVLKLFSVTLKLWQVKFKIVLIYFVCSSAFVFHLFNVSSELFNEDNLYSQHFVAARTFQLPEIAFYFLRIPDTWQLSEMFLSYSSTRV